MGKEERRLEEWKALVVPRGAALKWHWEFQTGLVVVTYTESTRICVSSLRCQLGSMTKGQWRLQPPMEANRHKCLHHGPDFSLLMPSPSPLMLSQYTNLALLLWERDRKDCVRKGLNFNEHPKSSEWWKNWISSWKAWTIPLSLVYSKCIEQSLSLLEECCQRAATNFLNASFSLFVLSVGILWIIIQMLVGLWDLRNQRGTDRRVNCSFKSQGARSISTWTPTSGTQSWSHDCREEGSGLEDQQSHVLPFYKDDCYSLLSPLGKLALSSCLSHFRNTSNCRRHFQKRLLLAEGGFPYDTLVSGTEDDPTSMHCFMCGNIHLERQILDR